MEWNALGERELLFQRVGVAIAQGNSMILDSMDHDWRGCGTATRRPRSDVAVQDSPSDLLVDLLGGMP